MWKILYRFCEPHKMAHVSSVIAKAQESRVSELYCIIINCL